MANRSKLLSAAAAVALQWPVIAVAQAPDGAPPASDTDVQLSETTEDGERPNANEIVITAQKRVERLQDTAAAVSVATGDELINLGAQNLNEIESVSPSVKITPIRNQTMIYLRGVGQALTQPNADPSVAVNVNGAYVPSDISGNAFFDVDRVEVLPGPQGTLYGRNAAGGVINVITRMPGDELGAEGYVELGNYDRVQTFAAIDVPLGETFGARAAFIHTQHDGYMSNDTDDQDSTAARLTLKWEPGAATKVVATGMWAADQGIGPALQTKPTARERHMTLDPHAAGLFVDYDSYVTSFQVDHELTSDVLLTYIAGYDHMKADANTLIFLGPPPAIVKNRNKTESFTQEARLSATAGRLELLGGLVHYRTKAIYDAPFDTGRLFFRTDFDARSNGEAAFGRATWHASDDLRLTGGVRFSHDVKKIDGVNITRAGPLNLNQAYRGKVSDNRIDWKAEVEFDLTDANMLYAHVATGYNTGGLSNAPAGPATTAAATFEPVRLLAYTAGMKNSFADGRLVFNVEGYYYDYKDYQVSARNPQTFQNQLFNAKESEIYGVQLEGRFQPTRNDDLAINANYLHAEIEELITPAGNFAGFELPYSPKWTANASYRRRFELANRGHVEAFGSYTYVGDHWAQYTHLPGSQLDSYKQIDAALTYRAPNHRWSFGVWGRNLSDEDVYSTLLVGGPPGPAAGMLNPPRTYGVRFGMTL